MILVTRAVQVLLFAEIAKAQASSFIANFDAFDANRWSKGDHRLSRSYLDPTKVSVSNRKLQIKLPGSSLDGEELVSNSLYGYSSQSARMKPPNASTSITGFSLYEIPYYESEIDSNSTATPQRESRLPPTRVAP